jgi:phosphoserine phosphatase RsbU/P
MTASDEEWGEEGLIGVVRSLRAVPVMAIIRQIMTSADVFVAGAPQYDDMTLIVLRVSEENSVSGLG